MFRGQKKPEPSELKDLDSHLDKEISCFSILTEVVAIPQVSLECSQLWGRVYTFLFPASSETQA